MGIRQTVAPTLEPLTLAETKKFLRETNDDQDGTIAAFIKAARDYAENRTHRQLMPATWQLTRESFYGVDATGNRLFQSLGGLRYGTPHGREGQIMYLPFPPLVSVTGITYYDANNVLQTHSPALYEVDVNTEPGRIAPVFGEIWPITYPRLTAVMITYTAGYASADLVPDGIKEAMRLLIGCYNEYREDFLSGTIISRIPRNVDDLLDGYWVGESSTHAED
jgi:hypothetical protein